MFKSKSPPPPPPKEKTPNFRSEITGVERKVVKNADGTETIVETALPLSPEEQALQNQWKELEQTNLAKMEELSAFADASQIPQLQERLQSFRQTQVENLERSAEFLAETNEEALARRGLANSTASTEQRAQREAIIGQEFANIDAKEQAFAESLRNQEMARAQNMFNIGNVGRTNIENRQLQGAQMATSSALGQQQANLQASQAFYNNQLQNFQMKQAEDQRVFGNIMGVASLATFGATGGFSALGGAGAGLGSVMGSADGGAAVANQAKGILFG